MNTVQRVLKNAGVMLAANVTQKVFTFFWIMYMARYLGVLEFGIFTFGIGFTELFATFADFGLNTFMEREVARDKSVARKYLGNIFIIKMITTIFAWGVIIAILHLLDYSGQVKTVVYLLVAHILLRTFSNMFNTIIRAHEKMEYQSLGDIFGNALTLCGIIFVITQGYSIEAFALVYVITSAINLIYTLAICAWKFVLPKLEVDWQFWKNSIKNAWPMGTMGIFYIIYFRVDTVMISFLKNEADVGFYGAAFRLSEILIVLPAIFEVSIFPVLSRFYKNSKSSFYKAYEKSMQYLFSIALPLALAATVFAPLIINLIYGQQYENSVSAFRILVWAAAIMYVTIIQGTVFIAADKQLLRMKIFAASVVMNIVLNLVAIPRFSYIGASVTTVISELFLLIVGAYFLNKYHYKLDWVRIWLVPIGGFSLAAGIAVFLLHLGMNIFISAALCVAVYAVFVILIGLKKEDRQLFKFILSR